VKAIVQGRYGAPADVLEVRDVAPPVIKADEVLVRVRAASVHIGDCHLIRGVPYLFRPVYGLRPAPVPGTDMAGTVEAVGDAVTQLVPGDEVFGWGKGAFAELARARAGDLLPKPAELTFEQAAAVGVSAFTALQALRDHGRVQPGQRVLINGASGGVGTFAVQIARVHGAEVTGVCSSRNVELVRSIGADHVIDYTREDFTQGGPRYDLILDNVGNHSFSETRRALAPGGTLLSNGSPVDGWVGGFSHVLKALVASLFVRQQGRPFMSVNDPADHVVLRDLVVSGAVTPVIGRSVPIEEAVAAIAEVASAHGRGTTVIST
jgi:NADPH:quinone reductase-like Zn-dependent oxidoreductase